MKRDRRDGLNSPWLFVAPSVQPPTGQTEATERLVELLARERDIDEVYIRALNVGHAVQLGRALARAVVLISRRPTGVYISARSGHGWPLDVVLGLWARLNAVEILVLHLHSREAASAPTLLRRWGYRLLDGRRTRFVALCRDYERIIQDAYAFRRASFCTIANPALIASPALAVNDRTPGFLVGVDRPRIGFLSNISEEKGAVTFAALARRLFEAGLISGAELAGPCRDVNLLRSIEAEMGDCPWKYWGGIYDEEKARFWTCIDWLIFPSVYVHEYAPMVVCEAQANGIPVLASDLGCTRELLVEPSRVFPAHSTLDFMVQIFRIANQGGHSRFEIAHRAATLAKNSRAEALTVFE